MAAVKVVDCRPATIVGFHSLKILSESGIKPKIMLNCVYK